MVRHFNFEPLDEIVWPLAAAKKMILQDFVNHMAPYHILVVTQLLRPISTLILL